MGPKVPDKEDDPELMARVPEDDVWIREYYPDPRLKFLESVHQLRQFASPEMADNMAGVVTLHLTMDMSTKKKVSSQAPWSFAHSFIIMKWCLFCQTKFLGNFSNTIVLPHKFGKEVENRVVAFCKVRITAGLIEQVAVVDIHLVSCILELFIIIIFCIQTPEDIAKAREAGAVYVGGLDLISTVSRFPLRPPPSYCC